MAHGPNSYIGNHGLFLTGYPRQLTVNNIQYHLVLQEP